MTTTTQASNDSVAGGLLLDPATDPRALPDEVRAGMLEALAGHPGHRPRGVCRRRDQCDQRGPDTRNLRERVVIGGCVL